MSKFLRFAFLSLAALAMSSPAEAARLYFTTTATLPGGGAPIGQVPSLTFNSIGETQDLYVWVDLEEHNFMEGYGLDITAATPGIVTAVSSEMYNPNISVGGFDIGDRWQSVGQPTINPNGAGTALLARNARGASVNPAGSAGIFQKGPGPMDEMYDATNDVFLAQKITLRSLASGTTGLVMRIGEAAFGVNNSNPPAPLIKFGAGTQALMNNAVGATDGTIHANVTVAGGPVGPTLTYQTHAGTDVTGTVVFNNSAQGTVIPVAGSPTQGRINIINYVGQDNGSLPLFFDLVPGADASALVTALNAIAGRPFTASLSTNGTADLVLNFANVPAGTNAFIDFNFGAGFGVQAVGIPEPSSIVLAAMGLVGLVGYRIRRRKA